MLPNDQFTLISNESLKSDTDVLELLSDYWKYKKKQPSQLNFYLQHLLLNEMDTLFNVVELKPSEFYQFIDNVPSFRRPDIRSECDRVFSIGTENLGDNIVWVVASYSTYEQDSCIKPLYLDYLVYFLSNTNIDDEKFFQLIPFKDYLHHHFKHILSKPHLSDRKIVTYSEYMDEMRQRFIDQQRERDYS